MSQSVRPGPPGIAARGHRWVPDVVPLAEPVQVLTGGGDRKCVKRVPPGPVRANPCNATAQAMVRGQFLCANHLKLGGMWIESGIVMRWALEPTEERHE